MTPNRNSTEIIEQTGCEHIQAFLDDLAGRGMTLADLDPDSTEWLSELITSTSNIVDGAEMSEILD